MLRIYDTIVFSHDRVEIIRSDLVEIYKELGLIEKKGMFNNFEVYTPVDMEKKNLEQWLYT